MSLLTQEIPAITTSPEDVYVVHACFGNSESHHFVKRVICIYVQNLDGSKSRKFSLERYIHKANIPVDLIEDWYNDLEVYVLDDFNSFLTDNINSTFIYWDEGGQELVLDVIKARFEELNKEETGKIFRVTPVHKRKSFQYLIKRVSGDDEPTDLKLLIKKYNNDQIVDGYLNNGEEINCFAKREFNKIGDSIVAKVSFLVKLVNKFSSQKHRTVSRVIAPIDLHAMGLIDVLRNLNIKSWLFLFGLFGSGYGIGFGITSYQKSQQIEDLETTRTAIEVQLRAASSELERKQRVLKDTVTFFTYRVDSLSERISIKDSTK